MATTFIPSDPLFPLQWHLFNQGNTPGSVAGYDINVISVWPDYSGQGVLVGVMDQGMDNTHPDLAPNYRSDLAWDLYLNVPGGAMRQGSDVHGVPVAGLVSAVANNGIGGVGVAWGSEFTMFRTPLGAEDEDDILSFQRAANKMIESGAHVMVNSWGMDGPLMDPREWEAYNDIAGSMVASGREGLGISLLFAVGNEGDQGFSSAEDSVVNHPWVIAVGASDQAGGIASYSTPGSSVLVLAPGSDPDTIVAPDRQGIEGYNPQHGVAGDYTTTKESYFSGTSAATPIAAGVVTLMLEANLSLGYRDVQEILVYSSSRATFLDREYSHAFNAAVDWNGGALLNSHEFGYGHIDAHAAVRLAESWMKTSTVANLGVEQGRVDQHAFTVGAQQQAEARVIFSADHRIEHLMLTIDLETDSLQSVVVDLVSPHGTESRPLIGPAVYDPEVHEEPYKLLTEVEYNISTVLHWGKGLAGEWTLRVSNHADGDPLTINDWSLQAYTAAPSGGTQIFTDEFARFADLQPTRSQIDAANGITLNAAAVTSDVHFDLSGGLGRIGDIDLILQDADSLRHLVSGDGDDVLVGNSAENILMAGRGNNHVDGGAGLDALRLIGEYEHYRVERFEGWAEVHSHGLGDGGVDVLYNVELLVFEDQVVLTNTPTDLSADLFDETAYLGQNPDVAAAVTDGLLASGREHYLNWGMREGRNPNDLFSEAWYLSSNADVAQAVRDGLLDTGYQHYQLYGWNEGRNPSAWMDTDAYLSANPDVAAAQVNPLQHYLLYGLHEGRTITALEVDFWI